MALLHFDIESGNLQQLVLDLAATEQQTKFALTRALARTATTLRTMASRQLRSDLELRTISLLRKRMKSLKLRVTDGDGFTLWFGLNDMPVSWFKGAPKQEADGASHKGDKFEGGFIGRSRFKKKNTVFKRTGSARLHITEQLKAIGDKANVTIEDQIFVQAEAIFWKNFERDLTARVNHRVGQSTYRRNTR